MKKFAKICAYITGFFVGFDSLVTIVEFATRHILLGFFDLFITVTTVAILSLLIFSIKNNAYKEEK